MKEELETYIMVLREKLADNTKRLECAKYKVLLKVESKIINAHIEELEKIISKY